MAGPAEQPDPEVADDAPDPATAYVEAWENALQWKKVVSAEGTGPDSKQVHVLSLLVPPQDVIAKLRENPKATWEDDLLPFIAQTTAEYASRADISPYVPSHTHVILYPRKRDADLFPEHGEPAESHLSRGGYPAMFISMRGEDGSYGLQPFLIGHELGEIITTQMFRNADIHGSIGHLANLGDHPLKTGLCEVIGLDFYRFIAERTGGSFSSSYDDIHEKNYRRSDVRKLLGDFPYNEASGIERSFMNQLLSGSIVHRLVQEYGLEKVLQYFAEEAKTTAEADRHLQATLASFSRAFRWTAQATLRTERPPSLVSEDPRLKAVLEILGYQPSQFDNLSSSTKAVDDRPEGAIAALIADTFSTKFSAEDEALWHVPAQPAAAEPEQATKAPSFMEKVIKGMDGHIAKQIFGEDFSAVEFINTWMWDFLHRYA